MLLPEIDRQHAEGRRLAFRADTAFAKPEVYAAMETPGVKYTIRIPANENLECEIADPSFGLRAGPAASRSSGQELFLPSG